MIDGFLDGFESSLEGLPNLVPKLVTCPICSDIFRVNKKSLPVSRGAHLHKFK
jgi:hypothetical protein